LIGVLDLDSPSFARFDLTDLHYLTRFADTLAAHL
jgi:L-methionine (R)-S-oxide reductase